MEGAQKRSIEDAQNGGSVEVQFNTATFEEELPHRKRRRHSSSGSSFLTEEVDSSAGGNKVVSFILRSDSEDESDWINETSIKNVATPVETPVDNLESRPYFNDSESAKVLALKAFRRVDSTASELNCLSDPNLSENVVDMPEDPRDPFGSLPNLTDSGFLRSESVASDLKRMVSNPGSDVLSPDIFKGNLHALKNHDNTSREQAVDVGVQKQNSGDIEWLEQCPDWLQDDYFDKEMSKIDSSVPRQTGKPSVGEKEESKFQPASKETLPSSSPPNTEADGIPYPETVREMSVENNNKNLGIFEPDQELRDAQNLRRKHVKKCKLRRRHCSRGKMGPPAYYKNLPCQCQEDDMAFDESQEDYSLKGRGKNWPPKAFLDNMEFGGSVNEGAGAGVLGQGNDIEDSDTQEYELDLSQGHGDAGDHERAREEAHNTLPASEFVGTEGIDNIDGTGSKKVGEGSKSNKNEEMVSDQVGDDSISDDMESALCSLLDKNEELRSGDPVAILPMTNFIVISSSDEGPSDSHFYSDKGQKQPGKLNRSGVSHTVTDASEIPEGHVDAVVINIEDSLLTNLRTNQANSVSLNHATTGASDSREFPTTSGVSITKRNQSSNLSNEQRSSGDFKNENSTIQATTSKPSLSKITSLQKDAQNIASVLGGSNVDAIYEKLSERRDDGNRLESVMNDILEGRVTIEGPPVGQNVDFASEDVVEENSQEVDIFKETQIILEKLQKEHNTKDIDPNGIFGLVESSVEKFKSSVSRINHVIGIVIGQVDEENDPNNKMNDSNDEDLFLRDVEQIVKKFPDIEPFQIYSLLEAHRAENNRVHVVTNELSKSNDDIEIVNVEPAVQAPTKTGERENVLYHDMMQIANLFPDKNRNEIYAYLEAHYDAPNRVQVVTEEFLRMSQGADSQGDVPLPPVEPDDIPTADSVAANEPVITDLLLQEQVQNLTAIFPDCDPNYLYEGLDDMKDDPDRVKKLASSMFDRRNYPKKKDVLEREKKHQGRLKILGILNQFNIKEFLELFPDPAAVFYSEEKPVSELYEQHVCTHLVNSFPFVQEPYIRQIMKKHNNHLTTTLRDLEQEVAASDLSNKKSRLRYPGKFRALKRSNSKKRTFPQEPDEYFYKELAFTQNEVMIQDYTDNKKRECKLRIERARENGELYECQCCYEDEVLFEEMKACIDGHLFCSNCVAKSAETAIGSGKLAFPCLNGECKEGFTMKTLQEVLPSNVFSGILNKIQEEEVKRAGIENLVSCPFCSFATIMDDENDKVLRCQNPSCLKESCRMCQEPNHIPLKCEEVEKQGQTNMRTYIENKISEAMIRTCWKCTKRFYKIEGCNKMTCSCGATMCYVCRAPSIDYNHFGSKVDGKCPSTTNIFELHRIEMEKAGLTAKKEFEEEHPETAAAGVKFDPLQHVREASAAVGPGHPRPLGLFNFRREEEEEEEYDEEEDPYDDYEYHRYGRRRYHDYDDEEEEDDY